MNRLGLVSVHTCPLAALGGKETGGMNGDDGRRAA